MSHLSVAYCIKTILLLVLSVCMLNCCHVKYVKDFQISFYCWKHNLHLTHYEEEQLAKLQVKKLYVKFFDIVYDSSVQQPRPISEVEINDSLPQRIIPCVFIANEVMASSSEDELDTLAVQILRRVRSMSSLSKTTIGDEIHLDCDWTERTKNKFFRLINLMKTKSELRITSTLRLFQLKYPHKMGVPPVDEVVLMCYNMSSPANYNVANSIYDVEELEKYIKNIAQYPLVLKIALPLYSWGCVFRDQKFVGYINGLTDEMISSHPDFKKINGTVYKCKKSTKFRDKLIYKGDVIRVEEVDEAKLTEGLNSICSKIKRDSIEVLLFHLDEQIIRRYEKNFLVPFSH